MSINSDTKTTIKNLWGSQKYYYKDSDEHMDVEKIINYHFEREKVLDDVNIQQEGEHWIYTKITNETMPSIKISGKNITLNMLLLQCELGCILPEKTTSKNVCGVKYCINPEHWVIRGNDNIEYGLAKIRLLNKSIQQDKCRLWQGYCNANGYGLATFKGRQMLVHRLSMLIEHKILPEDKIVRHRCPNKNCFAIEHLEFGTDLDNAKDKVRDGTLLMGEDHPNAKITNKQAKEIYESKGSGTQYIRSKQFNVSKGIIASIDSGRTWKHMTDVVYIDNMNNMKSVNESDLKKKDNDQDNKKIQVDIRTTEQEIANYCIKVRTLMSSKSSVNFAIFINPIIKETVRYFSECNVWFEKINNSWILMSRLNLIVKIREIMEARIYDFYISICNNDDNKLVDLRTRQKYEKLELLKKSQIIMIKDDFIEKYLEANQQFLLTNSILRENQNTKLHPNDINGKIEKIGNYKIGDKNIEYSDYLLFNESLSTICNNESPLFTKVMNSILKKEIIFKNNEYFILKNYIWIKSNQTQIYEIIYNTIGSELKRLKTCFDLLSEDNIIDKEKSPLGKKIQKCINQCGTVKFREKYLKDNINEFLVSNSNVVTNNNSNELKNVNNYDYKDPLSHKDEKLYEIYIKENISIIEIKTPGIKKSDCYAHFYHWLISKGGDPVKTYNYFNKHMLDILHKLTSNDDKHRNKYFYCMWRKS